jgi:hypothetical protein
VIRHRGIWVNHGLGRLRRDVRDAAAPAEEAAALMGHAYRYRIASEEAMLTGRFASATPIFAMDERPIPFLVMVP